jgi:YD repeat-containing protein
LDARGNITGVAYDTLGLEKMWTDPLGHISRFDVDGGFGDARLVFNEEGTGFGQYFEYTDTGNLKSLMEGTQPIRDLDGNLTGVYLTTFKTQYTYDLAGNLASVIDANLNTTGFLYDSIGNLTKLTDALGKSTDVTYETVGGVPTKRISSIKDPLSRLINFSYDPINEKVTQITTAAGNVKYVYDTRDRLAQITDALNRITQFQYNANDRLTETRQIGDPQDIADDIVALFDYDRFGNLTSLAGPLGGATAFTYDLLNRLTRILAPETTPLTRVEQAKVENLTSNSAQIRFNVSEEVSRAVLRVNEEGRTAFKTVTLEGPLSGDIVFDVDGLTRLVQIQAEGFLHKTALLEPGATSFFYATLASSPISSPLGYLLQDNRFYLV